MDAPRFDHLARSLTGRGTRRGLVRLMAALPLLGGLAALLASDEAAAAGRRKRRKKRHKHGRPGPRHRHKHKRKQNKNCKARSRAGICAGTCGVVRNGCKQRVDCGPCPCDPPCQDGCCGDDGICQPGASDSACGTSGTCVDSGSGRRCLAGECVCDSESCADGCCDAEGQCLPDETHSCGTGGVACAERCTDDGADPGLGPEEAEFLTLLNQHRIASGLLPLAPDSRLVAAAEAHSLDMATRGYFDDTSPEGDGPLERVISQGYDPDALAENIAAGFLSAEDVFTAWRDSEGHNANMLSGNVTEVGIGRAFKPDSQFVWYWTVVFASPAQA